MKKLIFTSVFIFLLLTLVAQENLNKSRNLTLKFPLSSLAGDIHAESMGFGVGLEKMIKSGFSLSQEIGYIFHMDQTSILSEDIEDIHGVKFTTEIRKYFNRKDEPVSGFFTNLEMKNIYTQSAQESWTLENARIKNEIVRYRGLLTANVGVLFFWDKDKKSKLTIELMGGGGLGYQNARSSLDTVGLEIRSDYNSGKGLYPWLNLDIKIGYMLR